MSLSVSWKHLSNQNLCGTRLGPPGLDGVVALSLQEMFYRGALISLCLTSGVFLSTHCVLPINTERSVESVPGHELLLAQ